MVAVHVQEHGGQRIHTVPPVGAAGGQHLDELVPAAQAALGPHSSPSCQPGLAHDPLPLHRPQGDSTPPP